jgi:rhodanese-related sulfurtransferase
MIKKILIISILAMIIIMPLSGAVGVKKSATSETFIGFLTNDNGYTNITAQEAFEEYLSCYCAFYQIPIDVRTESEWNEEHIETYGDEQKPVNWPNLQEGVGLSEFLNEYADKEVSIYCRSGVRSWKATQLLIDNGFTGTIYNMVGGILAWKAAEYPTAISVHKAYEMLMSTSNGIQTPIDIRTVEEWKKERIKTPAPQNPVNYPDLHIGVGLNEFMTNYEGKEVIIYCKTGIRSDQALDLLILKMFEGEFNGYVHNMIGGIDAWIDAGYPTPTPIKSQVHQTRYSNLMNLIQNKPQALPMIRQLLNI